MICWNTLIRNADTKTTSLCQPSRRYDDPLMVPPGELRSPLSCHWGTSFPPSTTECLIDSSLFLLLSLISSPHTSILSLASDTPGLFDHSTCLCCTAESYWRRQWEEERRGGEGKGRMERKHSTSLFFTQWRLALWEWSSLWGIWELNTGVCMCERIFMCVGTQESMSVSLLLTSKSPPLAWDMKLYPVLT